MSKKKDDDSKDIVTKKIIKMYQNYGIDVADMSDEEFNRIKESYTNPKTKSNIDTDLKKSEQFIEIYKEDII